MFGAKAVVVGAIAAIVMGGSSLSAETSQRCLAKFTSDTRAVENPDAVVHSGFVIQVTELRIDRVTGAASFCAHGDYCYPVGGLELVTKCSFQTSPDPEIAKIDPSTWFYYPQ